MTSTRRSRADCGAPAPPGYESVRSGAPRTLREWSCTARSLSYCDLRRGNRVDALGAFGLRGERAEDCARLDLAHLSGNCVRVEAFGGELLAARVDQIPPRPP